MKKIYNLIKKNKLEKVLSNFFSLSILQITNYVFPLITIPYITSVIGLKNFGILVFATALSNYFLIIVDYGFNLTAVKEISKNLDDSVKIRKIFTKVFISKLVLLVVSIIIFLIIIFLIPIFRNNYIIHLFSFFVVLNNLMYPVWFFHGIQKMKFIATMNVLIQAIYLISIFYFINKESDYIYIPLILGVPTFLAGLIAQLIMYKKYNIYMIKIDFKDIIDTIKKGKYVFINQLSPNMYKNSTALILGFFAPISSVGLYASAEKIISISCSLIMIFSRSFFPHLANSSNSSNSFEFYRKIMLCGTLILLIVICFFSNQIYSFLYPADFKSGVNLVYIMSFSLLFFSLYDIYGTNGLIHMDKEILLMKNTVVSSIFGLVSGIFLIYFFYEYGAAINIVFARFMMGMGVFMIYTKIKKD